MNLFVMWTDSFGQALKVSNQMAEAGGHVLDCSIIGKWSQVMVNFEDIPMDRSLVNINAQGNQKKAWIPGIKNQIVESYLSLSTNRVLEFILSIETEFIGDVFEFLQALKLDQFPIVDLRLLRFNEPKVLLLLTGSMQNSDELLVILENLKSQGKINFKFELISPVGDSIKELFNHENIS